MKRLILTLALIFSMGISQAQTITNAHFKLSADGKRIRFMELAFDNGYRVGINDCREIAYVERENGIVFSLFAAGLDVKYYDRFDMHDPQGKIKSIGNIEFKYNNVFNIHDVFGTLRSVGEIEVKYNNVFDIHDPKGTVKSVGNVQLTYYNTFDSDIRLGDLKEVRGNSEAVNVVVVKRRRG